MVKHDELTLDGYYLVHPAGKVISGITYWTTIEKVGLAERILREEFGLVDESDYNPKTELIYKVRKLVYEKNGPRTGIYNVHLVFEDSETYRPSIYLHHWFDRMSPEDFEEDHAGKVLERLYKAIKPYLITGPLRMPLKEKLPWEE